MVIEANLINLCFTYHSKISAIISGDHGKQRFMRPGNIENEGNIQSKYDLQSEGCSHTQANQMEAESVKRRCRSTEAQTTSLYDHPMIGQIHVDYSNVPSHMHTACDILPCPHENGTQGRTADVIRACHGQEITLKLSSNEHPIDIAAPIVGIETVTKDGNEKRRGFICRQQTADRYKSDNITDDVLQDVKGRPICDQQKNNQSESDDKLREGRRTEKEDEKFLKERYRDRSRMNEDVMETSDGTEEESLVASNGGNPKLSAAIDEVSFY